jgi:hypothetical protein
MADFGILVLCSKVQSAVEVVIKKGLLVGGLGSEWSDGRESENHPLEN